MTNTRPFLEFQQTLHREIKNDGIVMLRISNKRNPDDELKLVTIKPVLLKKGPHLSFVYRNPTQDITKNFEVQEAESKIIELLESQFMQAELQTTDKTYYLSLFYNGNSKFREKLNQSELQADKKHDHEKYRMIKTKDNIYLQKLGITTSKFEVKSKMNDKYKQINKYVEIIDDILKRTKLPSDPHILDMGSGKGYLTFALYDYFRNIRNEDPHIFGIEIRKDLVEVCTKIAVEANYPNLHFENDSIQNTNHDRIDFLIALHACDTATDDAIHKGISAGAPLIICAPCCHKQVRKCMKTTGALEEITQHGILKERQAEILTDTMRALILEAYGYKTRVFEFISTSHTPKNVLIVASLYEKRDTPDPEKLEKIQEIKRLYGISHQHLEKLFGLVPKTY